MSTSAQQDIIAFNFHYLSMLQHQLLIDPLKARYVFNVTEEVACLLTSLDSHQLVKLSATHRLLCDFTVTNAQQLEQHLQAPIHLQDAYRAHAAIMKTTQRYRQRKKKASDEALWGDIT